MRGITTNGCWRCRCAILGAGRRARSLGVPDALIAWEPPPGVAKVIVVDGGYRATGKWRFASGSANATWMGGHPTVFETVDRPPPGYRRCTPLGGRAVLNLGRMIRKRGQRSQVGRDRIQPHLVDHAPKNARSAATSLPSSPRGNRWPPTLER
jgi:hypothetical protein